MGWNCFKAFYITKVSRASKILGQIGPKEEVLATTILTSNFVGIIWSIFALNSKLINNTRAFNLSFCLHQSLLCSNLLSLLHFSLCFCLLFLSLWSEIPNALRFSFIFLHFLAMVSLEFLQKKTNSAEVTKEDISFSGDFTTLSLHVSFSFPFYLFSLSCSLIQLILPKGSLR